MWMFLHFIDQTTNWFIRSINNKTSQLAAAIILFSISLFVLRAFKHVGYWSSEHFERKKKKRDSDQRDKSSRLHFFFFFLHFERRVHHISIIETVTYKRRPHWRPTWRFVRTWKCSDKDASCDLKSIIHATVWFCRRPKCLQLSDKLWNVQQA